MVITSVDNAKVQEVAKLADKKYRKLSQSYVIEGERLVRDAIFHGAQVQSIFVAESAKGKLDFADATIVSDRVFAKMSTTVNSQGVLAVAKIPQNELSTPNGNCLILDNLQDPGNIGTLIRTAVACGFTDIYAVNCADVYSPKVVRSAMSAHFCLRLHQTDDIAKVFEVASKNTILACDMGGKNIFDCKFTGNVALVLGNEGNGLSSYSRQKSHDTVSLPMANSFESLNVAVAGSVIMYQIYANTK